MTYWGLLLLMFAGAAQAAGFTGQDYSGVYDCTGDDAHEGNYTGKVMLKADS